MEPTHDGPLGELLQYLAGLQTDDAELACVSAELQQLESKLPVELKDTRDGREPLDLLNAPWLRKTPLQVQPLLLDRLLKGAEA